MWLSDFGKSKAGREPQRGRWPGTIFWGNHGWSQTWMEWEIERQKSLEEDLVRLRRCPWKGWEATDIRRDRIMHVWMCQVRTPMYISNAPWTCWDHSAQGKHGVCVPRQSDSGHHEAATPSRALASVRRGLCRSQHSCETGRWGLISQKITRLDPERLCSLTKFTLLFR